MFVSFKLHPVSYTRLSLLLHYLLVKVTFLSSIEDSKIEVPDYSPTSPHIKALLLSDVICNKSILLFISKY